MNHSFGEAIAVGGALFLSDMFLAPLFAQSELFMLLKFLAQAYIVLWVDDVVTKQ